MQARALDLLARGSGGRSGGDAPAQAWAGTGRGPGGVRGDGGTPGASRAGGVAPRPPGPWGDEGEDAEPTGSVLDSRGGSVPPGEEDHPGGPGLPPGLGRRDVRVRPGAGGAGAPTAGLVVEAARGRDARAPLRERPPVVAVPAALRGASASVSWPAVAGLVVLLVVAVVVLGVRVVGAQQAAAPVAVTTPPRSSTSAAGPAAAGTPGPAGASGTAGTASAVVVDVTGAVARPGVQRLPAGSRVVDALTRAGGTTADADLATVNRARALVDGEALHVPRRGETPVALPGAAGAASAAGAGAAAGAAGAVGAATGAGAAGAAGVAAAGSPVDLNTADATGLDSLPGVGPAIAARILAWRAEHGRFTSVDELGEVPGIGDKTLERLRPLVRVGP